MVNIEKLLHWLKNTSSKGYKKLLTYPTFQSSTGGSFYHIRGIYTNIQAKNQGNTDSFHLKKTNKQINLQASIEPFT